MYKLIVTALAICASFVSIATAEQPTTLSIIGPATRPGAVLSPSGRYLAVVNVPIVDGQERSLLFIDTFGEEAPVNVPLGGETDYRGMVWANDDRLIFIGSQERNVRVRGQQASAFRAEIDVVRMFSIDRKGKDLVVLFKGANSPRAAFSPPDVVNLLPNEPDHVLMAAIGGARETLDLWRVNIETGKATSLHMGDRRTSAWSLDADGDPVFRTSINPRGTYLRTYLSADKGESWELVHEQVIRDLANESPTFAPIAPAATPDHYTIIAQRPGDDRMAIHEYNINTKEFTRTLFEHPDVDVTGAILDPYSGSYLGARYAVDKFENHAEDQAIKPIIDGLAQALGPDVSFNIVNISLDGNRFLINVSGPQAPGDYYIYDRARGSLDFILSSRPELSPDQLSPVEIMRTKMSDGKEITSYVTHPKGDRDGVYPLMVVPHGGPQSRDFYGFDRFGQFFASRGYRVIQTNFRGSAGYGEKFVESGHREWGKRMQEDVMESAEALVDRGIAQKKNMCVFGWSYGGYVAMTASFKNTDLFSASISTAGVGHLIDSLESERNNNPGGRNSAAYRYWSTAIGSESSDKADLNANSASENADKVGMPVLLFHGVEDFIVPVEQSRRFNSALKSAGKPVEYHEYLEAQHGIVTFENDELEFMFDRTAAFCKEHLPK